MLLRALPVLLLAAAFAGAEDTPAPPRRVHVVAPGETLSAIALAEYGSSDQGKLIVSANPGLDPRTLVVGQELVLPEITVGDPSKPVAQGDPDALEVGDCMAGEEPVDELADRRDRHAALIEEHPQLDGGGIAAQWKRALAAAEDAQRAVPADGTAPHVRLVEACAALLDRELELDELLGRMELEGAVLDAAAALREQEDPRGAKAKRIGALRGEMLAAAARQNALLREAMVLHHHAAHVDAEAEDKEAEAEQAATRLEALRSQLDAIGDGDGDAEVEPVAPPEPAERNGF
jgi:hypothetical protein